MGFIAEFRVSSPLMREAAGRLPEASFRMEELQFTEADSARFVFWTAGETTDRIEAALAADPTVGEFSLLTTVDEHFLYRASFTPEARQQLIYSDAIEHDVVYLELTVRSEGTHIRAQMPSREALSAYREHCRQRDIAFQLESLYREDGRDGVDRYGLTDRQREALVLAYESGYFDDTRETTLEGIAEELGISRQALAGRLRRGHRQLIANTLR